ncbi:LOW QUALITY PROTEIN: hypothetical protein V2J09_008992, partial [Rumex salicifolius]
DSRLWQGGTLCSLATSTLIKRLKGGLRSKASTEMRKACRLIAKLGLEFRLLKRQSRRATGPGQGKESEGKRRQESARSSNSLQQTGMSKQLRHFRVPIGRQPFRGFLRDRFTLRRLTERRKPSTGRRSCFSQDFSLLMSAFSLLISPGVVTKNLPRLTERPATDT